MLKKNTNETCAHCEGREYIFLIKLIPATQYARLPHAPKFVPAIKQVCAGCHAFRKFATQTPELIELLNAEEEKYE